MMRHLREINIVAPAKAGAAVGLSRGRGIRLPAAPAFAGATVLFPLLLGGFVSSCATNFFTVYRRQKSLSYNIPPI